MVDEVRSQVPVQADHVLGGQFLKRERLELLARGTWQGSGVLGPEAFDAKPFLDLLTEYGSPWGMREGR